MKLFFKLGLNGICSCASGHIHMALMKGIIDFNKHLFRFILFIKQIEEIDRVKYRS